VVAEDGPRRRLEHELEGLGERESLESLNEAEQPRDEIAACQEVELEAEWVKDSSQSLENVPRFSNLSTTTCLLAKLASCRVQ
jgi:hypothetical protein